MLILILLSIYMYALFCETWKQELQKKDESALKKSQCNMYAVGRVHPEVIYH